MKPCIILFILLLIPLTLSARTIFVKYRDTPVDVDKKDVNTNQRQRLKEYIVRLLPTLYIVRHGLDLDMNELIDNSEYLLTQKHLRKLESLNSKTQD